MNLIVHGTVDRHCRRSEYTPSARVTDCRPLEPAAAAHVCVELRWGSTLDMAGPRSAVTSWPPVASYE
ncbi:MAG: hypothetical protein ABR562_08700 [Thermoplasmatota archaeon]